MLDLSLGSSIYINDIWDAAVQEIDLIFGTVNTELIGYPSFGTNFDEFLWSLTPTTTALEQYIEEKLRETSFVSRLNHHVLINYHIDEKSYENVYNVTITLYDDYRSFEKTYNLTKKI